ncbi:phosphoenolpyruvate synthase [Candidatus Collierbacteria bacterium RIFOXYB2_FULL_46_14]|uniref:Phosphoenolpyruvate synthase n=1 Tax=Candidatus Collierbacteria bacterium GW2011_GWA2_46_26 TaxID=1618381 RepID=A0A0G1PIU8_9BACT|nr:MAG: Phosphoenolpyruvate synthase [Candidatus Collierbacteria bacterium GW2011_GWC2_44_13]KKU32676.1 MAG: Phosphoenolpyruvate synthase [Candidatus Collierbacteria bacterium GW2011_GWA2_46_26]OGD73248.1 MAG: phosphoenolpyruvate synthase [Candidatus Collierbacteria bacterium RIFOXYB2_FULL_46_14]OGD76290.1 MAG: phosphoenolpyruvate synthase [Candidatus Collierbacteria bacterium RIFOXYA2_FULL_46_20]OGD77626.1 MAG: phosphoenolpyruvate synthase [Candidatus Collierbacteria bacterium RIFOXYC2_FULL_43
MSTTPALVLPFNKIRKEDIPLVGGKGANLGEMYNYGIPVPNGFVITAQAYQYVIDHNALQPVIREIIRQIEVTNQTELEKASVKIQRLINTADIPLELTSEIFSRYESLKPGEKNPLVAVRSSATAEDLPDASFAGQQESYLDIKGESNVLQAVRKAWASLWGARAIFYRATKGYDHFKVQLAVPVQLMIQSEVSGVVFSVNPVSRNKNQVVVEAVWGLGDYMVQGVVNPDHYIVNKDTMTIHSRQFVPQTIMEIMQYPSGVKKVNVPKEKINLRKLTDEQVIEVAKLSAKVHQHYFFPQDSEFAVEDGKIYLVQTRPITTLDMGKGSKHISEEQILKLTQLLQGEPASFGIGFGKVVKIKSASEINKVKEGAVLVTEMTSPDFVPAMKRAAAIVTDKGGQTSHAAIVSRELGVPAVVGTKTATKTLKDDQVITVNGSTGTIYKGVPEKGKAVEQKDFKEAEFPKTATHVYVNLGEPDLAPVVAQGNSDGVGLLRAEFMMAQIGVHPKKMIRDGKEKIFIDKLAEDLAKFTFSFGDRPIVYRASDFKTNEYRNLVGGQAYEPIEPNPMLGFRGAYRYISDESVFNLELEAIKIVRNKMGFKNLHLMVPFVRTVDELIKVKRIVSASGLTRSNTFKLWMMVEIPSNVILLEDFIQVGIDGVSIGSNDLTMLILGTDRDNETVASEFDERNPAVTWALEHVVKTAAKHHITSSLCGQAASLYPDLVEKLVGWGITSVSVSPDAVDNTRRVIAQIEKHLLK